MAQNSEKAPHSSRPQGEFDGIEELDPLSGMPGLAGIATVPGSVVTPGMQGTPTVKEHLVRSSLSEEENRLTEDLDPVDRQNTPDEAPLPVRDR